MTARKTIVALSGGVGGAKLVLGLSHVLEAEELLVVANTGDDFEHLGFSISPDIDTLTYTLAGLDNPATGWGRRDETWSFMEEIGRLGGPAWFRLGDRDLALHAERTRRLRGGERLSTVTAHLCQRFGIRSPVIPMSDDPVRTRVLTEAGWLDFQEYFVREQCRPGVRQIAFEGAKQATIPMRLAKALGSGTVRGVVICPSNPFISIDPILSVPGLRNALRDCGAPIVAVSPIVGRQAVKGPTAKMMQELGIEVSAAAVSRHYGEFLHGFVVDDNDAPGVRGRHWVTPTLMKTLDDRRALARSVLEFLDTLS